LGAESETDVVHIAWSAFFFMHGMHACADLRLDVDTTVYYHYDARVPAVVRRLAKLHRHFSPPSR
jgi:hypothetical protein